MKTVYLSSKDLSRCSHCGRHNQVKKEDLASAKCEFCAEMLLSNLDHLSQNQLSVKSPTSFGSMGQKLLVGLMTATASLSACEQEEAVEGNDQAITNPQADMQTSPTADMQTSPTADMNVQESDQNVPIALYGIPAPDIDASVLPTTDMKVEPADEFLPQPEYGAPVGDYQVESADATLEVTDYGLPAPEADMSMGNKQADQQAKK